TQFTESVIREMTRLNDLHGGVNLSQGFPDFPAPAAVKASAIAAIQDDVNQYAVTWGARPLREAIAREFTRRYGPEVVADEQVTVCCGSTEAMMSTMMAVIDPGDEVVVFEPFYEINGLSKTYSVTGWRVGWTISPPSLTGAIRKVHDFLTVGAPAPLQEAGAVALGLPDQYYRDLAAKYQRLRDMLLEILERHHFTC